MDQSPRKAGRLQFTVARLLACTTLVALAAWAATANLPVVLKLPPSEKDIFPIVAPAWLLTAAAVILFKGASTAKEAAHIGCALLIAAAVIVPFCLALADLIRWLA